MGGFPGGSVVKNPPANTGDTSFIPSLGRFLMPRNNEGRVSQVLSLSTGARESQPLNPCVTTTEVRVP